MTKVRPLSCTSLGTPQGAPRVSLRQTNHRPRATCLTERIGMIGKKGTERKSKEAYCIWREIEYRICLLCFVKKLFEYSLEIALIG